MSLSALLLKSGPKKIDAELDALFKSNPAPPRDAPASQAPPTKKRKIEATIPDPLEKKKKKRGESDVPKASKPAATLKPAKKSKRAEPVVEMEDSDATDDDEDNSDLENAYLGKQKRTAPAPVSEDEDEEVEADGSGDNDDDDSGDAESDADAPPPVHESLTKRVRTKPAKKTKTVPENETPEQRNARTLFIGELPVEVAQKKPLKKALSRHLLSFAPSSSKVKIESIRFRSVAFRDPTSSTALSSSSTVPAPNAHVNANSVPIPAGPNHAKVRASTWRQSGGGGADEKEKEKSQAEADGDSKKEYLTPAQKKKILFIQGAFHPKASSVTAYVVLAHPTSVNEDADADTEKDKNSSPYVAAQHIARLANASAFMERTLRVDVCARLPDADAETDAGAGPGDPKLSIFLGNLDFGSAESDVREFFEGVVAGERGPASSSSEDGASGRWVQSVRLIRDRETQLGKGFGYVCFVDRECVDEILALAKTDEGKKKLRFAKRTLRVQRCRVVGTSTSTSTAAGKSAATTSAASKSTFPATPPKRGDPTLGARLAHLDKDARKAAKRADAGRLERRAEKKKMGTRMRVGAGGKGMQKGQGRERERKARVHNKSAGGRK
ncbi:hypothetical protein K438DRAFT_1921624 [Mycena galopus ATCC 62051]|nr:hypothetical protein K438DRAFT_1921624 [Mycena galopus ATCC 62051]